MPEYLTLDSLMAFKLPDPLSKDVTLPELGGIVHVDGIVTREDRKAINEEVNRYRETLDKGGLKVSHPVTGKTFTPDISDVVAACWVSKCVTSPPLTTLQWLQFAGEGYRFLPILFSEALICSREEADPATNTPDGVAAAAEEIEDGQAKN